MKLITTLILCAFASAAMAQNPNPIRVNQVGFYPNEEKTATIEPEGIAKKYVLKNQNGKTVWSGKAVRTATSPISGKVREIIDFSEINTPGEYTLTAGKQTQHIIIKVRACEELAKGAMKAFYLNRSGEDILPEYAGVYARPAFHMDNNVMIHPSAASENRPAGTIIQSHGGWYDAGDYNKYIVNSGFSVGLMLHAYEMNKDYFNKMELNIPENKNNIPDFLDEIMVNIKWMETMQDPEDGGVYHKLTTPNFEGFIMPKDCKQQRYVVQKTTCAALDFAATMALASRIYGEFPEYKSWAENALKAAEKAYAWAESNPSVYYMQNEMNKNFKPAVNTGAYDDMNASDEFAWAATEIALAKGNEEALMVQMRKMGGTQDIPLPSWGQVGTLSYYALIGYMNSTGMLRMAKQYGGSMIDNLLDSFVGKYLKDVPTSCYNAPYGNSARDFNWGGIAEQCCGRGIAMLYAYRLSGDKKYLKGALEIANYMLGQNATGYCYVTGFGNFSPKHPHQRLSSADGIDEPLPGFLVGGPNPGQQDGCKTYPSKYADESYADDASSYASNEIAINWNASLAAFIGWLDAEMK